MTLANKGIEVEMPQDNVPVAFFKFGFRPVTIIVGYPWPSGPAIVRKFTSENLKMVIFHSCQTTRGYSSGWLSQVDQYLNQRFCGTPGFWSKGPGRGVYTDAWLSHGVLLF
jgi:hypothetical protein